MCGLAGVLLTERKSIPIADIVDRMAMTLVHRGPDNGGTWVDSTSGIGLSHRRLSILDLSEQGHQPMVSENGNYIVVFNGEIYNHESVRQILEKDTGIVEWKGHSDTETLVEAIARWGVEKTLKQLVGMFALAVWDREREELTLARDRLGEKPLYFGVFGGTLVFASELRALRKVPGCTFTSNPAAVEYFLRLGYVPEPLSIFESVHKVPAGTFIRFTKSSLERKMVPLPTEYWSFIEVAERGHSLQSKEMNLPDAVDGLEEILLQSIKGQLMGDVPVGAFLSGGVDSSTVVALMQQLSRNPVKTFSIGFDEARYDESKNAEAISRHLGTEHYSMTVGSEEAKSLIPDLAKIYDEPFADSSQIPTYLVSRLAGEQVTVSLSGDGGDELFAGYRRYEMLARLWPRLDAIPSGVRTALAKAAVSVIENPFASSVFGKVSDTGANSSRVSADLLLKAARLFMSRSSHEMYSGLTSTAISTPPSVKLNITSKSPEQPWPIDADLVHQMMALDTLTGLPGDILVKVDRASMSHGLESRMPFLDHRVVEFAWTLPLAMKLSNRESKIVLRNVLARHVPRTLFDRPKMGFGIPLAQWLRGPLQEWAEDLLTEQSLNSSGFLDAQAVRTHWAQHLNGSRNHHFSLWNVLMFQAWHQDSVNESSRC